MKKRLIKSDTKFETYWECGSCDITSETEDRLCPCPKDSCEAEAIGEKIIEVEILRYEPKMCGCGKPAKWVYMPSSDGDSLKCEDCVPRGCSCNRHHGFDDEGREWPCVEWDYDMDEDNFKTL